jgi:uncharacterized membrane protein
VNDVEYDWFSPPILDSTDADAWADGTTYASNCREVLTKLFLATQRRGSQDGMLDFYVTTSPRHASLMNKESLHHAQEKFLSYEKYGLLGLALFIALPIPGSGIFTGTMIAFLMGVHFKHSLPYIWAAVIGSSFVTMFISVGIDKVF